MSSATPKAPAPSVTAFPVDLDRVSLQQALRDFELANARVLDLTQRLIASEKRRTELENELNQLKVAREPRQSEPQGAIGVALKLVNRLAARLAK
jgi:hypothetical protein